LHRVKDKVWIAGRPGSVLLHSDDGGATWSFQKTGQPMPLHSVFFFDEKLGFAVGDAGTILKSNDGGKNWLIQHQGGKRAAATCIHWNNKTTPVDTLAHLGAADGYLVTSLRVTAPDPATVVWGREQDERRYAAAVRLAGGMAGETMWHFPLPQYLEGNGMTKTIAHWDQLHNSGAVDELLRQLVLGIRMWRPSVLVIDDERLVGSAVKQAVELARDGKAFPEQVEIGLAPWMVERVLLPAVPAFNIPDVAQHNDEPNARLQMTVRDFAAASHSLILDRFAPLPKERTYHSFLSSNKTVKSPMAGIDAKVGEARRDIKLDGKTDEKLQQTMLAQRSVIAMADNIDDPARAMKLIPPMLDKLPDEHAAFAAFAIAGRYVKRGQWYAAQEFYLYLADRAPAHPLTSEAYRWLLALNASSEARRRNDLKHFVITDKINLVNKKGPPLVEEKIVKTGFVVPPGQEIVSRSDVREWNKGSAEWAKRLAGFGSIHALEPRGLFCSQSAVRNLGDVGSSVNAMDRFRKFVPAGPWHDAARSEIWLTNRNDLPPPRLGRVRYTEVRPYLDGKFGDPCWKDVKPMILDNAVGDTTKQYKTEAMFAFDQEFLYIALQCMHPAGQRVEPIKPRPRDADMDALDRVSIMFDLDRDYATYYHLEIDQRGCLRDSCWGDRSWNPKWFVAVHSTDTAWHIEAAIPLSELTGDRIMQQTAWAFNVVRVMPGRGVQSWSLPADVQPRPEGMSVLLFDHGKARAMPGP